MSDEGAAPDAAGDEGSEGREADPSQELDRLRAEVAELRARYADLERSRTRRPVFSLARGSTGRRYLSTVLVVLGIVLVPVSVLSVWTKNTITNTDQYVSTVAPLATDPAIQAAVTNRITDAVYAQIDVPALVSEVLPPKAEALAGPLGSGIKSFIHDVTNRAVTSRQFEDIWVAANRAAQAQVVGALEGTSTGGVSVENGTVTLDLSQLVTQVKQQLSAQGFTAVDKIPTDKINGTLTLFQSTAVTRVQWGFRALNFLGDWLPVIVAVLLAAGVLLARDRRRALLGVGAGAFVAMLIFGIGVALGRNYLIAHLPATVSRSAAEAAIGIVVRFLVQAFWAMLVLGLLIAVAAVVAGPSAGARLVRTGAGHGMGRLGDHAERAHVLPTRLRVTVGRHRRAWEVGVVAAAVVVILVWRSRTVAVELWIAFVAVLLLLVVQLVGRRGEELDQPSGDSTD